jgi:formate dehydrogenase gamma subunit
MAAAETATRYRRFSVSDRIEHWIQVVTFVGLALTGLPQRYHGAGISEWTIDVMGGIESVRIIHRVLATILMLSVVYHFMAVGYRKYVMREPRSMVPGMDDLRAIGQSVGHAVGLRSSPPRQGRFTWEEKAEYWALVWGTVVMIITGFLLWNPIATTTILPGQFVPAAKAAHGGEAVLAVLAIIVWHMYHVHLRHLNTSIFTGYMSRKEMELYHPLELDEIDSGVPRRETDPAAIRQRSKRFFPVFGAFAIVMLLGIYFFVSFEDTAIETISPPEQVEVFAPVETTSTSAGPGTTTTVPATTTMAPPADATWDTVAAFFDPACTSCHGDNLQTAGLSLASYEAALAGGSSGPGIVPGDPEGSVIVQVMEAGGHPALLDAGQLATLREWILAGAPSG